MLGGYVSYWDELEEQLQELRRKLWEAEAELDLCLRDHTRTILARDAAEAEKEAKS